MKKLIPVVLLAFIALTSCERDPDMGKLDGHYMVYTNYDTKANFEQFSSFYLADSILLIGNGKEPEYWEGEDADEILETISRNMIERGYLPETNKSIADLGIQISYIKSTYTFTDFDSPSWWWGYPGYWGANYWGNWGGGYYPYSYAVNYNFSTNSFITEMVNLTAVEGTKEKLPVLWNSFISGYRYSSSINQALAIEAIDQSFKQSPYLAK